MNHWYFWVLAPVMLLSGIIIPLVARPTSVGGQALGYAIGGTLWLATLGLANPRKFWWALRAVAAAVVVAGLWYFASEALEWWAGKPLGAFGRRSSSSLWNAGLFLLVFGLPALRYLISGRSGSAVDAIAAPESFVESNASAPQAASSDDGQHDKRTANLRVRLDESEGVRNGVEEPASPARLALPVPAHRFGEFEGGRRADS